jgi:hypothetical protein
MKGLEPGALVSRERAGALAMLGRWNGELAGRVAEPMAGASIVTRSRGPTRRPDHRLPGRALEPNRRNPLGHPDHERTRKNVRKYLTLPDQGPII